MPDKDYYQILGVAKDADAKTIKRAFLKKARQLHPDVNKAPDAEEQFKKVNEAYAVLSDERKRSNYDRFGSAEGPGGFGSDYVDVSDIFGGGFGINDIFDSFFGGGRANSSSHAQVAGRDMSITLTISLSEAAAGCKKTISYERLAPCDDCNGSGLGEGGQQTTCERCGGSGRVVEVQRTIFGQMQTQTTCPVCHGAGKTIDKPCESCNGQGRTPSHETVEVVIPAGIHSGQALKEAHKGEAGVRGARCGDLIVNIQVEQDKRFERQGDDLFCTVEIDALEAIVGTTRTIEGILKDEQVILDIPAAVQFGQQIRREGFGMPRLGMSARGALIAVIQIKTPNDLSGSEIKTIKQLLKKRTQASEASAKGSA